MKVLFWSSAALVVYTYVGYPIVLLVVRGLVSLPHRLVAASTPTVTMIIPAYNEAPVIAAKVRNALDSSYPPDRITIIVVSDGSTDDTDRLAADAGGERLQVLRSSTRRGKAHAMNLGAANASGSILLFTDANVFFDRDAVDCLVSRFADSRVGAVVGRVALRTEGSHEAAGESLYMRYERGLHQLESDVSTMVTVDGAMFAVRRALYTPLAEDSVVDDFVTVMRIIDHGYRIRYAPDATGWEGAAATVRDELKRKVRIIAGGWQTLAEMRSLLNPLRRPAITLQLISHKVLRWLVPLCLIGMAGSTLALLGSPFYRFALAAQVLFYGLALASLLAPGLRSRRICYFPFYLCAMNLAALLGLVRFLLHSQSVLWERGR
jgi:cellulose synthase/poly-beta-1,6-N-acetylglucosamine synthase-like glycosyltransferase